MHCFLFLSFALSAIEIIHPGYRNNFVDLKFTSKTGATIPFSNKNSGISVRFYVDNIQHVPKNLSTGPYEGITITPEFRIDENDKLGGYLIFTLKNNESTAKKVKLGTFTNIMFNTDDGNSNSIYPIKDAKGLYTNKAYYVISDQKKENIHLWQKFVVDHRDFSETQGFIAADNKWYGYKSRGQNNPFLNLETMNVFKDPKGNSKDAEISFSWNEREIPAKGRLVYGVHIYLLMDSPVDIVELEESQKSDLKPGKAYTLKTSLNILHQESKFTAHQLCNNDEKTTKLDNSEYNIIQHDFTYTPNAIGSYHCKFWIHDDTNNVDSEKKNVVLNVFSPSTVNIKTTPTDTPYGKHDQFTVEFKVNGDCQTTAKIEIYNDNQLIKSLKEKTYDLGPESSSTSDKITFTIGDLSAGKRSLRITVSNQYVNQRNSDELVFYVAFDAEIQNMNFDKNVKLPNNDLNLTCDLRLNNIDTSNKPKVKLNLLIPDIQQQSSQEYEVFDSNTKQLLLKTKIPGVQPKKDIQCKVWITDAHKQTIYETTLKLTITIPPDFEIKPNYSENYFSYGQTVSIAVNINDDTEGRVYYTFMNTENFVNYTSSSGKAAVDVDIKLEKSDKLTYSKDPYTISIRVEDEFGYPAVPKSTEIYIRNKPKITNIKLIKSAKPNTKQSLTVCYEDLDRGKDLYIYQREIIDNSEIITKVENTPFKSQGVSEYTANYTYPAHGVHNLEFFISSRSNINKYDQVKTSDSNLFNYSLKSSMAPIVEVEYPTMKIIGYNEFIEVSITVTDESKGKIIYKIDNRTDITFHDSMIKSYKVEEGKGSIKYTKVKVPIPEWCKYSPSNNLHHLSIEVEDEFGLNSNSGDLYNFEIRSMPEIIKLEINKNLLRSDINDGKKIHFKGTLKDLDDKKDLYFFIKESENEDDGRTNQAYHIVSNGKEQPFEFDYEVKKETAKNLKLTTWIEDDEDPNIDPERNGESKPDIKYINISYPPKMTTLFQPSTSYHRGDEIYIEMTVTDDTSGKVKFFFNGKDMNQDLHYTATKSTAKINTTLKLSNDIKMGTYKLLFYPVDEFDFEASDDYRKEVDIIIKNKPILSDVKLDKTKADNDETVNVFGKIEDFDEGKELYIFQRIVGYDPILLGNMTSNGKLQQFKFPLRNLVYLTSGDKKIDIWVTDYNNSIETPDENDNSDTLQVSIFMANDPLLIVTPPKEKVFTVYEDIKFDIQIIADLKGYIDIYDNKFFYEKFGNKIHRIYYNTSSTIPWTTYFKRAHGNVKYYFKAIGENLTKSEPFEFEFSIRVPPKLGNLKLSTSAASPGESVGLDYSVSYNTSGSLYFFMKMNGVINYEKKYVNPPYGNINDFKVHTIYFNIDLNQKGNLEIEAWVQNIKETDGSRYSMSETKKVKLVVTKPPTVDFNFPQERYYSYDDQILINLGIHDETKGDIKVYFDRRIIYERKYTSNNYEKSIDLKFRFPKEYQYKKKGYDCFIEVIDEYGKRTTSYWNYEITFYLLNKPKINDITLPGEVLLTSSYVKMTPDYNDYDKGKDLYLWMNVDKKNYKIGRYTTSSGKDHQKPYYRFRLPKSITQGEHILSFFYTTEMYLSEKEPSRNSRSATLSKIITFVDTPVLTLNEIPDGIYQKGSRVRLSGTMKGYQIFKIRLTFNDIPARSIVKILSDGDKFDEEIDIPASVSYGTVKVNAIPSTYGDVTGNSVTRTFTLKNKPTLKDFPTETMNYLKGNDFNCTGFVDDIDDKKLLYVYYQIGNADPRISKWNHESNGKTNQEIIIKFNLDTDLVGKVDIKIFVSDRNYADTFLENEKSNVVTVPIFISYKAKSTIEIISNSKNYYSYGDNMTININVEKYEKCTFKLLIDSEEKKDNTENLDLTNKKFEKQIIIPITSDISYKLLHKLELLLFDEFNFKTTLKFYTFNIVNTPYIPFAGFSKPFSLQNEVMRVRGRFNDIDEGKKLFIFVKVGENKVTKSSGNVISNGTNDQFFEASVVIPENEPIGKKKVIVWLSNNLQPMNNLHYVRRSNMFEIDLEITYKPSLNITAPDNLVYNDGQQIKFTGSVRANSNIYLHYKIDNNTLTEKTLVNITNEIELFEARVTIPVDYKYGEHNFNVWAVDINNQTTDLSTFSFYIKNPPKFIDAALVSDKIKIGDPLVLKGNVRDSDAGNNLTFIGKFDDGKAMPVHTIVSDSTVQEFEITFHLSSEMKEGPHKLEIYIVDSDDLKSTPIEIAFEIYSKDENPGNTTGKDTSNTGDNADSRSTKTRGRSITGLIAGIAIMAILLAVLICVAIFLFIKKTKNNNDNPQSSDNTDLEDRETDIVTTSGVTTEEATKDNPLFSGDEIGHDEDPFSDEFEEQNP
ncbi:hypothetical protein TVAG_394260 [Trichomonas vaginalis G3]|uniref:Bap-like n=1 Tax=Trichomonas vaginalis (strain ATCC PRA-98 / G3) TaxID=412133 RepID=A2DWE3_TRIV3|nr:hypothetical protein TVAGG3_0278820 [Trichomonas vaginalis G3]EAY15283.1 hypothetical protein TVAG_394260 [Trichomonas vaginalis G3]KAI5526398.1 hypothetical protein TVAGG3_0278820 [Trichomonas vaginalis G3]|eukprot:XP_001327506.1 hypothetical protein [Trichomonas vaginalis G3]